MIIILFNIIIIFLINLKKSFRYMYNQCSIINVELFLSHKLIFKSHKYKMKIL